MVTACIVLLYISYAIPVTCLLIRGRDSIPHGPFWLGKFGLFANVVLLLWTAFTLVMYSFPVVMPVLPGSEFPFAFTPPSSSPPLLSTSPSLPLHLPSQHHHISKIHALTPAQT